jgi:hypothetical protein|nr:MAG TPA: hypothetical protein [Caudoviricetes sp.]
MDDREARKVQREASEALLDLGVSLPLKEWRLPFMKRPVRWRVTMRRPRLAGQMRILHIYLSMDVSPEQVAAFTGRERLEFVDRYGVDISHMIALTLCRGMIARRLFVRPVAWFLREAVEHRFLLGAMEKFISLMGSENFTSIISSIDRANPMKLRMSQRRKGS